MYYALHNTIFPIALCGQCVDDDLPGLSGAVSGVINDTRRKGLKF